LIGLPRILDCRPLYFIGDFSFFFMLLTRSMGDVLQVVLQFFSRRPDLQNLLNSGGRDTGHLG
jgi:hypothetical protein